MSTPIRADFYCLAAAINHFLWMNNGRKNWSQFIKAGNRLLPGAVYLYDALFDPESMRKVLENGDVPAKVSNRMIFGAIMDLWQKSDQDDERHSEVMECLGKMEKRVDGVEKQVTKQVDEVEGRVVMLEKEQDESPSMIGNFKKNPRGALGWLVALVVILSLALALSDPLRAAVGALVP